MHRKYNLYDMTEARALSEAMKQEIKESLTLKQPSLAEKIQGAEDEKIELLEKNKMIELEH